MSEHGVDKKPQDIAYDLLLMHLESQRDQGRSIKSDKEKLLKAWDDFLKHVKKSMAGKIGSIPA